MISENLPKEKFISGASDLARGNPAVRWLQLPPGRAQLIPNWLDSEVADSLLHECLAQLSWERPILTLFGRKYPIPRRHSFVGDKGLLYSWSGLRQYPEPWSVGLAGLRRKLESCGLSFNSVLVNHYRDGADSMGWHADNEPELGPLPIIATISLGQERNLRFKPSRGGDERVNIPLPSGSLLLTSGEVQQHWQHQVAKSRRSMIDRVSLTFRYIKP